MTLLLAAGRWVYETPDGSTSDLMGVVPIISPYFLHRWPGRTASHRIARRQTWASCISLDRRRDLEQSGGQAFSFLPISRSFVGPLSSPEGENTSRNHAEPHRASTASKASTDWPDDSAVPGHVMAMQRAQYNSCLCARGRRRHFLVIANLNSNSTLQSAV